MITFSKIIKLITLIWLMNILSAGYCKADNSELNCMRVPRNIAQGTNSRKIPAVNKCAKGFENKDIIEKCEDFINRNKSRDTDLFKPAINYNTNVVYWNKYCAATCNNDTEKELETISSWNNDIFNDTGIDGTCEKLQLRIQRSEVNDLQNLTQTFISKGVKLEAGLIASTHLECSMDGKWPVHLIIEVIPCLYRELRDGQRERLNQCQYAEKTGRLCKSMKLYTNGVLFIFSNSKQQINENGKLSEHKFNSGQYYVETEYPGLFYICDLPGTIYGGMNSVKISIVVISLIFIIINLGINSNKRYLQKNNINKLLYFYMIGLVPITIILLLIYLSHPLPCVAFYMANFLWAYHLFWNFLIFIEFYLLVLLALDNCIVSGLRYLVCGIFGFVIPFASPIIYYFRVLVQNETYKEDLSQSDSFPNMLQYTCPKISGHFGATCTSYKGFEPRWLESGPRLSTYFFVPLLFLAQLAVLCYFRNYRSASAQSISYRSQLIVSTKMALIMGIHWVLFTLYHSHEDDYEEGFLGVSFDTLCQLSIDFHGIIVFIVFEAATCVCFVKKMCGCEYKSVSQQDGNNRTEMS